MNSVHFFRREIFPKRDRLDWRHVPALKILACAILLFLYVPILILAIYAFNANPVVTVWSHFSLRWFGVVWMNPDLQRAAVNSTIIAMTAGTIASLSSLAVALALRIGVATKAQAFIISTISLPLFVPEIVVAVTTLVLFSRFDINFGLGNLIIAHSVFCIPYAFLPIFARLKRIDRLLDLAARDLYASEFQLFWGIIFPLIAPAFYSGFVLAFVTSLDDFLISMMVAKAGDTTLPVYIYSMMRIGVTPEVNAVSAVLIAIPVFVLIAISMIFRNDFRTSK